MATDIERHEDRLATRERPRGARGLLTGALVIALLLAAGFAVWYVGGSDARTARNACLSAISGQLTSPGSAKFRITLVTKDSGVWSIYGNVDSQNTFGALLRSDFRCTVEGGQVTDSYVV